MGSRWFAAASKQERFCVARAFSDLALTLPPPAEYQKANLTSSRSNIVFDNHSAKMAPKKKVERTAQENISLGPQVREGLHESPFTQPARQSLTSNPQASSSSASHASSPPSTTPSSTSPISRTSLQSHEQEVQSGTRTHKRGAEMVHRLTWVIPAAAKPSPA
jgi:predicted component of type VI protein secretion system